jgi:uncharacterized protein (TIGR03000 family)
MVRRVCLLFALMAVGLLLTPDAAHAFGRRHACGCECYIPCCEPCWPPCPSYCYCLAYKDPYTPTGAILVRCDCCPWYLPSWQWCYVYKTGHYEWVKVFRCFYHGQALPKEALEAEGAKEAGLAAAPAPATLVVELPEDAKLTIHGCPTVSTGARRTFTSPALAPGQDFVYTVTAELSRDGKPQTVTRNVVIRAGEESHVTLNHPVTALAAR